MPVIPWPWRSEPLNVANDKPQPTDDIQDLSRQIETRLSTVTPSLLATTSFAIGAVTASATAFFYARYGRRIRNSDWVPPDVMTRRRWVKDLKDKTLSIRIAGVDAPEAAHFGRPAQPYSAESLAWLRETIQGKTVYCQLLRRDQYNRIVAHVTLSPRVLPGAFVSGKILSHEMLRAGWVTTYEQAGAEYGKAGKDEFLRLEAEAKTARVGMWAKGVDGETPAEYKRRHAAAGSLEEAEAALKKVSAESKAKPRSWLKRVLGW
ncbi:hypothetical protein DXG01_014645 [Tephrocybe rancida]|nr:hypothetical protein DXG01_014645 [Tephrocybe rancida]